MNALLEQKQTELEDLEFETDITVFGYIAAHYASAGGDVPVKGWAHEYRQKPMKVGSNLVSAGRQSMMIGGVQTLGVIVVVHHDHYNGGQRKTKRFFPMAELKNAVLQCKGVELP